MVDALDSKSSDLYGRVGSIPTSGTMKEIKRGWIKYPAPFFCPQITQIAADYKTKVL